MQQLWFRVNPVRRRGCRACSTLVSTAGRRATGVTGRRKATFAEIFTACYSSVFATAAIIDALRKDDRRRELDRQLDEARRQLSELQQRDPSSASASMADLPLSMHQKDCLWRSLKVIYQNRPFMKEVHKPATLSASDLVDSLKHQYYNAPYEAELHGSRQIDHEQLEQSIMAEELSGFLSRGPRKEVHLLRESQSIQMLVKVLLRRAKIMDRDPSESQSFNDASKLLKQGLPNYTYPGGTAGKPSILNARVRELIDARDMSIKERIGRICHNLLASAHAPDMHTYNTMIVAFDKTGEHALSEAVVHSFFVHRLLKPSPSTFTAILYHYRSSNNHGQFLRALACLTGLDGMTGGKMSRRPIGDLEAQIRLQTSSWRRRSRTCTGDWIWQHVPLNRKLIEAALGGLLHFKLFDYAAYLYVSCVQCGVFLGTQATKQLFDECVAALDWRAAMTLVSGLADCIRRWELSLAHHGAITASRITERLLALINLCGLGDANGRTNLQCLTDLENFCKAKSDRSPRSAEAPVPGYDRLGDDVANSARRLLRMESLAKEVWLVQKTTSSLESKLLQPDFAHPFRASMALHIGEEALQRSAGLQWDVEKLLTRQTGFQDEGAFERDVRVMPTWQVEVQQRSQDGETGQPRREVTRGHNWYTDSKKLGQSQELMLTDGVSGPSSGLVGFASEARDMLAVQ